MQDMYVRYLGVLLVELALGMPVFDVGLAANSSDLEITFPYKRTESPRSTPEERKEKWNETRDRLKNAGVDEAYIEVVKYCVECTWTRDDVSKEKSRLDEYYWKILHP